MCNLVDILLTKSQFLGHLKVKKNSKRKQYDEKDWWLKFSPFSYGHIQKGNKSNKYYGNIASTMFKCTAGQSSFVFKFHTYVWQWSQHEYWTFNHFENRVKVFSRLALIRWKPWFTNLWSVLLNRNDSLLNQTKPTTTFGTRFLHYFHQKEHAYFHVNFSEIKAST